VVAEGILIAEHAATSLQGVVEVVEVLLGPDCHILRIREARRPQHLVASVAVDVGLLGGKGNALALALAFRAAIALGCRWHLLDGVRCFKRWGAVHIGWCRKEWSGLGSTVASCTLPVLKDLHLGREGSSGLGGPILLILGCLEPSLVPRVGGVEQARNIPHRTVLLRDLAYIDDLAVAREARDQIPGLVVELPAAVLEVAFAG